MAADPAQVSGGLATPAQPAAASLTGLQGLTERLAAEIATTLASPEAVQLTPQERIAALLYAVEEVTGIQGVASQVLEQTHQAGVPSSAAASGKAKGKLTRGYVDGCFDIMHSGHYNAIRQAKMLCDVLVVGVHSDAEIQKHKGPPVMNDEERLAMVRACKWVDEVVFDTPYNPSLALLDKHNCDFSIHGDDTPVGADGKDAYDEVRQAGRFRIIKRTEGVSTTQLVGRLLLMTKEHHVRSPALTGITTSDAASPSPLGAHSPLGSARLSADVPSLQLPRAAAGSHSASSSPRQRSAKLQVTEAKERKDWVAMELPTKAKSPDAQPDAADGPADYGANPSTFLPTTWRIAQFSNHRAPKPDDVVVYIDGAFDLFHVGHVETLRKAKEMGSFLYVGIHDDRTVNLHKGRNYPIMNLHERVLNVLSCVHVDEVVIGAPWEVTQDLLRVLNISLVVSGSNLKFDQGYDSSTADDCYALPKSLGMFRTIETSNIITTTDVVERIIANRLKYEQRNANRAKKEAKYIESREYVPEL